MNIKIRKATEKDGKFIAWIMLTAARSGKPKGFWDLYIPDEAERMDFLEKMTRTKAKSLCHYSHFIIAEADGVPAGGVAVFVGKEADSQSFRDAIAELFVSEKWSEEKICQARERIMPHYHCMPAYPDEAWILEWVAVLPEYRRKGIMNEVLKEAIRLGKERKGIKLMQIAVAKGNTPAQNAYAKAGFRFADEKTHPEFEKTFGNPGIQRLIIEL